MPCPDDGRVLIRFENSFHLMVIEQNKFNDIIRTALAGLGRELGEGDVIFEVAPSGTALDKDDRIFYEINKS